MKLRLWLASSAAPVDTRVSKAFDRYGAAVYMSSLTVSDGASVKKGRSLTGKTWMVKSAEEVSTWFGFRVQ